MNQTALLREFRLDFENVCRTVELTRRYPNPRHSEILKEKKITKIIRNKFSFVEKKRDWRNTFQ